MMWKAFFEEHVERYCRTGRPQTTDAIAALVAFLASRESEDITGQALNVNGGAVLH
jgi:NAD(P)-dependent dehydrogenase (short-subunit alcohol dehydrogenase family)